MIKKASIYSLLLLGVVLLHFIFEGPFSRLDNEYTDIQFRLRGQVNIDSSIINLYIDKAIMDSLGRVPLKWVYYTRIIDYLSNLNVKAIGIENIFDKNSPDYPTQAYRLVSAIKSSGRVCVGGYFDKIKSGAILDTEEQPRNIELDTSKSTVKDSTKIFYGADLETPFPWLVRNAAGFGHLNFEGEISIRKVPLALANADTNLKFMKIGKLIPAFTLELLRIYFHLPKDSIIIGSDKIVIRNGPKTINIPTENSQMLINYCGGMKKLNMISISNFLNMYYTYVRTYNMPTQLAQFKGKIVLIGLVGKRTSQFASTPFNSKFPYIGIHANILDTILRERFLYESPFWVNILMSIIMAGLIFYIILEKESGLLKAILLSGSLISGYLIISFIFFNYNIILSVEPVIFSLLAFFSVSAYQYNLVLIHFENIEREKHSIESILNKSKQKIIRLEQTLQGIQNNTENRGPNDLLNNYHNELEKLTTKFMDLSPFDENDKSIENNHEGIIYGKNSKMEEVVNFTKKIAPTNATVLLSGESGTGKELIAKAIHNLSERKNKKFIVINCGAVPESLLESELFGHEEGAYTGANKLRKGYFETADNGTIFLDEITETNELFQTKLLRVLQSGEFNRVGGTETIKVDIRIIAASNKKIEDLVKEGKFREDLYYRLNVIKITIPPLRSRKNDIPALTEYFLIKENSGHIKVSKSVMEAFFSYNWPGNVRQLENVIKRSAILVNVEGGSLIKIKNLPNEIISSLKTKSDIEGQILAKLREKGFSHSSITETADELGGLHRSTISEYLRGICFRAYCNQNFDYQKAAITISGTEDVSVTGRVRNKMEEYINNLLKNLEENKTLEQISEKLSYKYKKLPNRYHIFLQQIIEHHYHANGKMIKNKKSQF